MAGYLWLSDGEVEGEGEYAEGSDVVCFFLSFFFWGVGFGGLGIGLAPDECARERERERDLLDRIPSRKLSSKLSFTIHIYKY